MPQARKLGTTCPQRAQCHAGAVGLLECMHKRWIDLGQRRKIGPEHGRALLRRDQVNGAELVKLISRDPNLKSVPVMIVSYKDRDEDRARGLEAGAAYYLTKGSFHDDTLVQAVVDLIGEA